MQRLPLSPLQTSLVFASQGAAGSGSYVLQNVLELPEAVNADFLKDAWNRVAARHPILRTSIEGIGNGDPTLCVHDRTKVGWTELDWSGVATGDIAQRLDLFLKGDRERGFDLGAGTPLRFHLIRHGQHSYTLVWTYHHVLLDGRSMVVVWREWFAIYEALLRGEEPALPPPPPFQDYAGWIRQQDFGPAEQFWRGELAGLVQTAGFVQERLRPGVRDQHPESPYLTCHAALTPDLTLRLRQLARRCAGTLNLIVMGAWALLLHRYGGTDDVVFGVTHTARPTAWPRESTGLLINTLPLRLRIDSDITLTQWLRQLREPWRSVREHRWVSAEQVRAWSGLPPGSPLFDSVVVYDTQSPHEQLRSLGGAWSQRALQRKQQTDLPLTLGAYGAPVLSLHIGYDSRVFSAETISGLVRHLETLLEGFVANPDAPLRELPMLPDEERQRILYAWNRTERDYPRDRCAHELIEDQARRIPNHTALERGAERITYADANRRANRIARLLQQQGASPEDLVAVCADHTPESAIAILAILKAGAAFLPLNPHLPRMQLKRMLELARPRCVLLQNAELADLVPDTAIALQLDELGRDAATQPDENLPRTATGENAVYAIFTSGSTGEPKAAVAIHRALVNATLAVTRVRGALPDDRRLAFVAMGSDVVVAEIFNTLACGATLVYGSASARESVWEFLRGVEEKKITIAGIPSSWWHEWVGAARNGAGEIPASMRLVVAGMERADPFALAEWKRMAADRVRWVNAYGPTETLQSTMYEAGTSEWERDLVPIGRPIDNTQLYVFDRLGRPVPPGVTGELFIGGDGVSRGYLGDPALTAASFLPDPFDPSGKGRLYRTGDVVFYLPDGNLVFVGRADRQVKIRGFRIELDGIESILAECPGVRQCAVALLGNEGRERLVGYVAPGDAASTADLRQFMAARLPDHSVPSAFVFLPDLPRTNSGKIDRQTLVRNTPLPEVGGATFEAPSTPFEVEVAELWQKVLGLDRAGVTDNFFEAGGNSLLASRLLTMIRSEFGCELALTSFWNSPTISSLAAQVEHGLRDLVAEVASLSEEEARRLLDLEREKGVNGP